jgi:hypothetical protein
MGIILALLYKQSLLLLLLPSLLKVFLLETETLNEIERGRIERTNHQPLRFMLEIGCQPMKFMLNTNTQPLQVMLGEITKPLEVMLGVKF